MAQKPYERRTRPADVVTISLKSLRLGPNFDHDNPNFVVRKVGTGKYMTNEEMMEATRDDSRG